MENEDDVGLSQPPRVMIVDGGSRHRSAMDDLTRALRDSENGITIVTGSDADRRTLSDGLRRSLTRSILMAGLHVTATATASAGNKVLSDQGNKPYYRQFEKKGKKK